MVKKSQKEMRKRLLLLKKAQDSYNKGGNYKPFDPIDYLSDKEAKEFMRLEFKLGFSDYNPDEE